MRLWSVVMLLSLCACLVVAGEDEEPWQGFRPMEMSFLPKHVVAPEGRLTLFADFGDIRGENIILYLVNRTKAPAQFDWQDGDIYMRLEFKNDKGTWTRAQTHRYSGCGNSYAATPVLAPGRYFKFLGYFPSEGEAKEVRYRRYVGNEARYRRYAVNLDLVSNVGRGRVRPAEVKAAATDAMAIKAGDFAFVSRIATGELKLPKDKYHHWLSPRQLAVYTLAHERFKKEAVIPVLERLRKDSDRGVALGAAQALYEIRRREDARKDSKAIDSDKE